MRLVKRIMGLATAGFIALGCGSSAQTVLDSDRPKKGGSVYDIGLLSLNRQDNIDLSQFKGRYILFVNVASKCGYTYQYGGLQALYEAHSDSLVVIGVPCNQFGFQEPGDSSDIATFCESNYAVTFPLSEKLDVKGKNQHPLYEWLTQEKFNGLADFDVNWNFNKFLVSPEGALLARFGSKVKPMSQDIRDLIK